MKFQICSFFVVTFFAGSLGFAQERRAPIERYGFEVEASSPSDIAASVDADGKIAVWSNYSEKVDEQGNYLSFSAKKFQVFEHGKQIKTTQDVKGIPRAKSVGMKHISSLDGIGWMPSGGIESDNKITFKGMIKSGFIKDTFIVGPFDYTIRWATPIGLNKAGFMYVVAECLKPRDTSMSGPENLRVFKTLYKVNKSGQVVDSFIFNEAKFVKKTGMGDRYPWEWSRGGAEIDENGQFYTVTKSAGTRSGYSKILIERWGTK